LGGTHDGRVGLLRDRRAKVSDVIERSSSEMPRITGGFVDREPLLLSYVDVATNVCMEGVRVRGLVSVRPAVEAFALLHPVDPRCLIQQPNVEYFKVVSVVDLARSFGPVQYYVVVHMAESESIVALGRTTTRVLEDVVG